MESLFPDISKSKREVYQTCREQQDFLVHSAMAAPGQISSDVWVRLVLVLGGAEPLKQHPLVTSLYGGAPGGPPVGDLKNRQWGVVTMSTLQGGGRNPNAGNVVQRRAIAKNVLHHFPVSTCEERVTKSTTNHICIGFLDRDARSSRCADCCSTRRCSVSRCFSPVGELLRTCGEPERGPEAGDRPGRTTGWSMGLRRPKPLSRWWICLRGWSFRWWSHSPPCVKLNDMHNTMQAFASACTAVAVPLIGLGLRTPAMRAAAIAAMTTGVLWAVKPTYFFDDEGKAKIWSAYVDPSVVAETTPFTWWMFVGSVAVFFDLCV